MVQVTQSALRAVGQTKQSKTRHFNVSPLVRLGSTRVYQGLSVFVS